MYLHGSRLAKMFITRMSTRAVVEALLEEGYIKLNYKSS